MILKKCHLLLIAKKLQYLFSKINCLRKCIVFHFLFGVTPRGLWPTSGLEFQAKSSVPNFKTFGLDPIILHRELFTMILKVIKSDVFFLKLDFCMSEIKNSLKLKHKTPHQADFKNAKKFEKSCQENLYRVTQPLKFFVQKYWLDKLIMTK